MGRDAEPQMNPELEDDEIAKKLFNALKTRWQKRLAKAHPSTFRVPPIQLEGPTPDAQRAVAQRANWGQISFSGKSSLKCAHFVRLQSHGCPDSGFFVSEEDLKRCCQEINCNRKKQGEPELKLVKTPRPKCEPDERYMRRVISLLELHWGLRRPSFLLSVTGGAQAFNYSTRLSNAFATLARATEQTRAWVFTGGTDAGVMQVRGSRHTQSNSAATHLPKTCPIRPRGNYCCTQLALTYQSMCPDLPAHRR